METNVCVSVCVRERDSGWSLFFISPNKCSLKLQHSSLLFPIPVPGSDPEREKHQAVAGPETQTEMIL